MAPEPSRPGDEAPARREALASLTREALRSVRRGAVTVSPATCSMWPFLRGGDRIHWRRDRVPRRGDLLLFLGRPGPVVHRVIGSRKGLLVTQGDNRPAPDVEPLAPADVVGVVVGLERDGRRWDLSGRGARFYGGAAALFSLAGGRVYRVAAVLDAGLRRLVPGIADVRFARPAAWFALRGLRAALHLLLFRACHGRGRRVEEDGER